MNPMKLAIERARRTMNKEKGGPFGTAIIDKNGKVIAITSNVVLGKKDPTAHAEMEAIRKASKKLKTYDLSECTLFATGYPCPMCLSAIIWANIKKVYYATDLEDAEKIGFRDNFIYDYLKNKNSDILNIEQIDREEAISLFKEYKEQGKIIY